MKSSLNGVNAASKLFRLRREVLAFVYMLAIPTTLVASAQETLAQNQVNEQPKIASSQRECRVRTRYLQTIESQYSVEETVSRLQKEIKDRKLGIFATIDHAANAADVDLELPPTTLIIFGSPVVGTVLMQNQQTIGIDLPLKYLVWQDACGTVRIGYNTTRFLKIRHRIRDTDEVFNNIENALNAIAQKAARD
ncbi:MAG: DUF302 domain-containing protein [Nostocaceae cyanobacterium]|nr:DUF302 domain-containing protein [Nostocaceae cyanobacterium]